MGVYMGCTWGLVRVWTLGQSSWDTSHSPVFPACDHIYLLKHQKFHKIVNSLNNELSEFVVFFYNFLRSHIAPISFDHLTPTFQLFLINSETFTPSHITQAEFGGYIFMGVGPPILCISKPGANTLSLGIPDSSSSRCQQLSRTSQLGMRTTEHHSLSW